MNLGLKSFAHNSRGLVRESDFWRKRPANLYRIESELKEGRALQAVARGMAILLRKGARWNDLSGVYLGRSDLTALDLAGINLDNSILAWSDFTGATLARASFDGADLEQTRFVGADLRSAKLTAHTKNSRDEPRFSYVQRQMERSREQAPPEDRSRFQVHISLPDFSCADLRDADFSGHALFGFARNGLHEAAKFYGSWPDFEGANLAGADMKHISVFVLSENDDRGWQRIIPTIGGGASGDGRYFAGIYQMNPEAGWGAEPSDYTKSLVDLQAAFLASNWGSAKLPRAIADWLAAKQVSQDASGRSIIAGTEPCKPRSPW